MQDVVGPDLYDSDRDEPSAVRPAFGRLFQTMDGAFAPAPSIRSDAAADPPRSSPRGGGSIRPFGLNRETSSLRKKQERTPLIIEKLASLKSPGAILIVRVLHRMLVLRCTDWPAPGGDRARLASDEMQGLSRLRARIRRQPGGWPRFIEAPRGRPAQRRRDQHSLGDGVTEVLGEGSGSGQPAFHRRSFNRPAMGPDCAAARRRWLPAGDNRPRSLLADRHDALRARPRRRC